MAVLGIYFLEDGIKLFVEDNLRLEKNKYRLFHKY